MKSTRMKDIDEIRRENIKALERELGGPSAAAIIMSMSLAQWANLRDGAKDSRTGKMRGMRKETARRIEAAGKKPAGWLDIDQGPMPAGKVNENPPPSYLKTKTQTDKDIEEITAIARTLDAGGVGMLLQQARNIAKERPAKKTAS